ncbi:MAG: hypothetical protein NZO16_00180 [Deltaproteobacteria bacterium]|nr:hypothetical protein [Deltaproteobacteria bacterium]
MIPQQVIATVDSNERSSDDSEQPAYLKEIQAAIERLINHDFSNDTELDHVLQMLGRLTNYSLHKATSVVQNLLPAGAINKISKSITSEDQVSGVEINYFNIINFALEEVINKLQSTQNAEIPGYGGLNKVRIMIGILKLVQAMKSCKRKFKVQVAIDEGSHTRKIEVSVKAKLDGDSTAALERTINEILSSTTDSLRAELAKLFPQPVEHFYEIATLLYILRDFYITNLPEFLAETILKIRKKLLECLPNQGFEFLANLISEQPENGARLLRFFVRSMAPVFTDYPDQIEREFASELEDLRNSYLSILSQILPKMLSQRSKIKLDDSKTINSELDSEELIENLDVTKIALGELAELTACLVNYFFKHPKAIQRYYNLFDSALAFIRDNSTHLNWDAFVNLLNCLEQSAYTETGDFESAKLSTILSIVVSLIENGHAQAELKKASSAERRRASELILKVLGNGTLWKMLGLTSPDPTYRDQIRDKFFKLFEFCLQQKFSFNLAVMLALGRLIRFFLQEKIDPDIAGKVFEKIKSLFSHDASRKLPVVFAFALMENIGCQKISVELREEYIQLIELITSRLSIERQLEDNEISLLQLFKALIYIASMPVFIMTSPPQSPVEAWSHFLQDIYRYLNEVTDFPDHEVSRKYWESRIACNSDYRVIKFIFVYLRGLLSVSKHAIKGGFDIPNTVLQSLDFMHQLFVTAQDDNKGENQTTNIQHEPSWYTYQRKIAEILLKIKYKLEDLYSLVQLIDDWSSTYFTMLLSCNQCDKNGYLVSYMQTLRSLIESVTKFSGHLTILNLNRLLSSVTRLRYFLRTTKITLSCPYELNELALNFMTLFYRMTRYGLSNQKAKSYSMNLEQVFKTITDIIFLWSNLPEKAKNNSNLHSVKKILQHLCEIQVRDKRVSSAVLLEFFEAVINELDSERDDNNLGLLALEVAIVLSKDKIAIVGGNESTSEMQRGREYLKQVIEKLKERKLNDLVRKIQQIFFPEFHST